MNVEVAYAEPDKQTLIKLELPPGATVADALSQAAIDLAQIGLSQSELDAATVGVFGQVCSRDRPLNEWDRVEVYRPLIVDAKEARRRRAIDQSKGGA